MRRLLTSSGVMLTATLVAVIPVEARPLEPEACAQLKAQRDALQANGLRDLVSKRPSGTVAPERLQQVRQLITLDGQLRFRCNMDLLLPTLKPDPVDEFVDAGDTAGRPAPVNPALKRAKVAKAAPQAKAAAAEADKSETKVTGAGTPAQPRARAAAVKTGTTEPAAAPSEAPPPVKATSKPRSKAEDAFRPPASGDVNGTPLNAQVPKSP